MAVSQGTFLGFVYHPTIVFLKGFLGVHRGTGVLTHSHVFFCSFECFMQLAEECGRALCWFVGQLFFWCLGTE